MVPKLVRQLTFPVLLFLCQILFTFLLGFHSQYKYTAITNLSIYENPPRGIVEFYYPMFTDIHVMMFVGFGFLMTFLHKYSYSSVGFNFITCAFTLEWGVIICGYLYDWNYNDQKFIVDVKSIITADFCSASILISMGAVLGKVNAAQLLIMAFIEVPVQAVNKYIGAYLFCASDVGESMYVHTFGAYFGLAVSFILHRRDVLEEKDQKPNRTSDVFAMIGTVFLFCFWPSFNAGTAYGDDRIHAVVNTYISICASVIGAFLVSNVLNKGKFDMVHIQNSTLAGGVAVGTVAGSDIGLHGAMVIGTLAGMLSVIGYKFLLPLMAKIRMHDTCGVHNLHGLPGLLAGITGIIVASIENRSGYLDSLTDMCLNGGKVRTNSSQSAFQAAALGLTVGMALVGGLIAGLLMRIPIFYQSIDNYIDEPNWELPGESEKHPLILDNDRPIQTTKLPPLSEKI